MARPDANRKFYDSSTWNTNETQLVELDYNEPEKLLKYVSQNIIGSNTVFSSPYGSRKVVYCDYVASGRSLQFIEDYILNEVLPNYGSTHTTSSVTALQTTLFRHEARDIIRNATRASEHDRVLFVGSGATGAIHKLLHTLDLRQPPLVIVDPFSHHSSLLPWREMGAQVIRIRETSTGDVDMNHLRDTLVTHQRDKRQMIGCFTAASNVTGMIVDDVAITRLLHQYGALAFWDYATAAPYVEMTMNPVIPEDTDGLSHKDAIFFSMHKFIGGVQTPGVLIAKKSLFRNRVPDESGGGTVFFVSRDSHRYLQDIEEREEGGTPAIVETVRAGLVMQLKMSLTSSYIMARNKQLNRKLAEFVATVPELVCLGNLEAENRLPILSFVVRHKDSGRFLHYNFVCSVLNDLYGIQARGGCACAGPYAQDLLGMNENLAQKYEELLIEDPRLDRSHLRRRQENSDHELFRPGFVRLNLSYAASDEEIDYILKSVKNVCERGWMLLPQYNPNSETGEWKHKSNLVFHERQWLQNISYKGGIFHMKATITGNKEVFGYQEYLEQSENIFQDAIKTNQKFHIPDNKVMFNEVIENLRWFLLPLEAQNSLLNKQSKDIDKVKVIIPFVPTIYPIPIDVLQARPDYTWKPKVDIIKLNPNIEHSVIKTKEKDLINDTVKLLENTSIINDVNIINDTNSNDNYSKSTNILPRPKSPSNMKSNLRPRSPSQLINKVDLMSDEVNSSDKLVCNDMTCFKLRDGDDDADDVKQVSTTVKKLSKVNWHCPPKHIFNPTIEAVQQYGMIKNGDKVLVCLSGGKDSLSLLHTLHQYQFYAAAKGVHYTLGAITVDPQSASYDPRPLIPYLASLGVHYLFESQAILQQAMELNDLNSICSFCSRMKRGRLYAAARREGYNVLAFGQHLDDLTESFIMSVFHNGRLRTMKASYTVKEGDLRVVRPFVFVREKDLREFAESRKLPIIPENCPACFEAPKERHRVKQLLAQQEMLYPRLYWSLRTALLPLMSINLTGLENSIFGKNANLHSLVIHSSKQKDEIHSEETLELESEDFR